MGRGLPWMSVLKGRVSIRRIDSPGETAPPSFDGARFPVLLYPADGLLELLANESYQSAPSPSLLTENVAFDLGCGREDQLRPQFEQTAVLPIRFVEADTGLTESRPLHLDRLGLAGRIE